MSFHRSNYEKSISTQHLPLGDHGYLQLLSTSEFSWSLPLRSSITFPVSQLSQDHRVGGRCSCGCGAGGTKIDPGRLVLLVGSMNQRKRLHGRVFQDSGSNEKGKGNSGSIGVCSANSSNSTLKVVLLASLTVSSSSTPARTSNVSNVLELILWIHPITQRGTWNLPGDRNRVIRSHTVLLGVHTLICSNRTPSKIYTRPCQPGRKHDSPLYLPNSPDRSLQGPWAHKKDCQDRVPWHSGPRKSRSIFISIWASAIRTL